MLVTSWTCGLPSRTSPLEADSALARHLHGLADHLAVAFADSLGALHRPCSLARNDKSLLLVHDSDHRRASMPIVRHPRPSGDEELVVLNPDDPEAAIEIVAADQIQRRINFQQLAAVAAEPEMAVGKRGGLNAQQR